MGVFYVGAAGEARSADYNKNMRAAHPELLISNCSLLISFALCTLHQ
jgi:hypothetical protein